MTAPALDLFPETVAQGPPLRVELGRIEDPEVVVEHRGEPVPYQERTGLHPAVKNIVERLKLERAVRRESRPVDLEDLKGVEVVDGDGEVIAATDLAKLDKARGMVWSYRPEHVGKYQAQVHEAARTAMGNQPPLEGQIEILITAALLVPSSWSKVRTQAALRGDIRPTGKRKDWDNLAKAACDACSQVVWRDDSQIAEAHVRKLYSATPLLRIEVRRLPTAPP